ncbi:UNVERIFIED_CONTAM: hypothetical protein Slati_0144500 [Sesamum latifolium]|uniref:Reverse transcriptase Ty1/copia-type domain-containing protein n=1 Tax=Sesamum latifolium TaxID=2727402 RepID=A0AAW2YA13_9LAMI
MVVSPLKIWDSQSIFLGLELARSDHGLMVSQSKYLHNILLDAETLDCRPVSTPFPPGLHLTMDSGCLLPHPDRYRRLVGYLLYLGFTDPDLVCHSVAQSIAAASTLHTLGRCYVRPSLPQRLFLLGFVFSIYMLTQSLCLF